MTKPNFGDMAAIPAGSFLMGSDRHYAKEAPTHRVSGARPLKEDTRRTVAPKN